MTRSKKNQEMTKFYFLEAVRCLGVERIVFANYKPLFKDDPIMTALINNFMAEQQRLRKLRRQKYYGPTVDKNKNQ